MVPALVNISLPTGNLTANTTFNVLAMRELVLHSLLLSDGPSDMLATLHAEAADRLYELQCDVPTIITQPSCNDRDAGEYSLTISRTDGNSYNLPRVWTITHTHRPSLLRELLHSMTLARDRISIPSSTKGTENHVVRSTFSWILKLRWK